MGKHYETNWTREKIFEVARQYKTRSEFKKGYCSAYNIACKSGLIYEMDWFNAKRKTRGYWTKEKVFEEAKAYSTKIEFRKCCSGAYNVARKNGWINEMNWFVSSQKPSGYWDIKDNVFKEARKYQTRSEFCKCCGSAYDAARKHGWLDEMTWFIEIIKPRGYWTKEKVFEEAKNYKTKNAFRKGCMTAYLYAYRNKWFDEMTWLKDERLDIINDKIDSVYKYYWEETNAIYIGRTYQQKERDSKHRTSEKDTVFKYAKKNGLAIPPMEIIEENITIKDGLEREDYWVNYYKEKGYNVLNKAKTGIGSGSTGAFAKGKWTKEKVFEKAREYKTRWDFGKKCVSAYTVARKNGWLDEMTWFIEIIKPRGYWTKEKVFEEASKYNTRKEFFKGCVSAYNVARRYNLLDELFPKKSVA